jgi:hypothetical protein
MLCDDCFAFFNEPKFCQPSTAWYLTPLRPWKLLMWAEDKSETKSQMGNECDFCVFMSSSMTKEQQEAFKEAEATPPEVATISERFGLYMILDEPGADCWIIHLTMLDHATSTSVWTDSVRVSESSGKNLIWP